ncbi:MAG: UDP-N-acetylglucosamine 2-epimerase (hydrolyzing) [Muribaculaceae bacterium]|nr:UDP-N-acetylglucosamine 2-epimerase (hydrolyzing) [Muribaculaceae bacterium]
MTESSLKKVCFVTSTRADWGLLMPIARELSRHHGVKLQIVATNMHLIDAYGMTIDEITAAGFTVDARVAMNVDGDDEASKVKAMSLCMSQMADVFTDLKPDAVIVLGDRYEMLAVASAATIMRIPIIHIAGGEISEGAVDDYVRHAITKLSTLHLTATEDYRRRVIQMGEQPDRVINTGAIGVWNAFNTPMIGADILGRDLNIDFAGSKVAVMTYHPATNDTEIPSTRVEALLKALDSFPQLKIVITYPNNDANGKMIIPLIERYGQENAQRVRVVRSLGMQRYQSLLRLASLVIGNSSSGIVEAPSAGVPTVDIGIRQRGRIAAPSVIHCGDSSDEIREAIEYALSDVVQAMAKQRENPYYKANTLELMVGAIDDFIKSLPVQPKTFFDI